MTVTAFLTGVCRLISGTFSAVFSEPLLTFFTNGHAHGRGRGSVFIYLSQVKTILK